MQKNDGQSKAVRIFTILFLSLFILFLLAGILVFSQVSQIADQEEKDSKSFLAVLFFFLSIFNLICLFTTGIVSRLGKKAKKNIHDKSLDSDDLAFSEDVIFCPNCSYPNPMSYEFCSHCGTRLHSDTEQNDALYQTEETTQIPFSTYLKLYFSLNKSSLFWSLIVEIVLVIVYVLYRVFSSDNAVPATIVFLIFAAFIPIFFLLSIVLNYTQTKREKTNLLFYGDHIKEEKSFRKDSKNFTSINTYRYENMIKYAKKDGYYGFLFKIQEKNNNIQMLLIKTDSSLVFFLDQKMKELESNKK